MSEFAFGMLSEIAKGKRGVTYKPEDLVLGGEQEHYRLLTAGNIQDGITTTHSYAKVTPKCVSQNQLISPNEILVCMSNGSKRLVGKSSRLRSADSKQYCVGAFCSTFTPNENADPEFVFQVFQSEIFKKHVSDALEGSAINNLKNSTIESFEVPIPPLPEQKKIAEILSGTQETKDAVARQISKVNYLEKCLLSSIFSQGEGEEWKRVSVSDIGRVIRGASPRPKGDPRYYGGSVPRLMGADVTRDGKYVIPSIDFLTEAGAKLSRPVPAGTLTIVCSGVVGVPSILSVDACIHDGFLAIVDILPECMTEYLFYYFKPLQQLLDSSATHGGIFTNLTTEILKDFPVSLPPLEKQREIVSDLRSIDSCRNSLIAKEKKIEFLLNSISSDLLSGRKRVSI